tara:strand:+ start:877 stop:1077 length:201 start_codon:yes stop_codon:yes gene_type:complete
MTLLELIFIWIIPIACLISAITFGIGEVRKDEETIKQLRLEKELGLKETIKQLKEELKQCHKQHSV